MVQTGDPTGTGKGGDSIWGGPIEDELNPELKVCIRNLFVKSLVKKVAL